MNGDGERLIELFDANKRDWTPESARKAACVLYAPVSTDADVSRRCASVLSEAELDTAERFVTEALKVHFIQRRAFRRYCGAIATVGSSPLSRIAFDQTDKGRPFLADRPDLWFSFSSCRFGFLGAWSSTHAVGVDIEDKTRRLETTELAQKFFTRTEAKAVEDTGGQAFFQLWTLKEAAMKSVGEGLPFGLDAFEFEVEPSLRIVSAPSERDRFTAQLIEGTDTVAALVSRELVGNLPRCAP